MNRQTCTCKLKILNPAHDFFGHGQIHIFISLNLSSFIAEASRDDFERLRGGQAFGEAFKTLRPEKHFIEDDDERETVNRGHEFQVFRGHLKDNWLFPTFLLNPEQALPPKEPALAEEWSKFLFRIRLSRTGLVEVKLTRSIPLSQQPDSAERLSQILQSLLEIGSLDSYRPAWPIQLRLALHCTNLFLQALPPLVEVEELSGNESQSLRLPIWLQPADSHPKFLPYHQRYMILFLDAISCKQCGHRIDARTFWERDRKTLAAILGGTLIHTEADQVEFPDLDDESFKFEDLATWRDELCVFAPESCLIYYTPEHLFLPGQFTARPGSFGNYWKCIIRGIEHTIAVRTALQITERRTTQALDEVPRLTKKVADEEISDKDVAEIQHMAQEIANTFNMLPILRDALVSTSVFHASYAVDKLSHLNDVLQLKQIQGHIQRNVDELVIFQTHFSRMRLQETSVQLQKELLQLQKDISQLEEKVKDSETTVNRIGIVIALIALLVAGPSFLTDFHSFFIEQYGWYEWTTWLFFALIGLLALFMILSIRNRAGFKGPLASLLKRGRRSKSGNAS